MEMVGDFDVDIIRQRRVGISMNRRADGASPSRNGNRRQEETTKVAIKGIKLATKSGERTTESNLVSGRREFTSSYVNACVTSACEWQPDILDAGGTPLPVPDSDVLFA